VSIRKIKNFNFGGKLIRNKHFEQFAGIEINFTFNVIIFSACERYYFGVTPEKRINSKIFILLDGGIPVCRGEFRDYSVEIVLGYCPMIFKD
jgi:hypothetical protein